MTFFQENFPQNQLDDSFSLQDSSQINEIINIITRNPAKRNKRDLKTLYQTLFNIPYFKSILADMPTDICIELLREIRYKQIHKAQTIYQAGDQPSHFHLLLKGSYYSLAIPKAQEFKVNTNTLRSSLTVSASSVITMAELGSRMMFKADFTLGGLIGDIKLSSEELHLLFPDYKVLRIYNGQSHFGEQGLQFPTISVVTKVCRETCHFLTLSSTSYLKILKKKEQYYRKKAQERLDFFKSVPLMSNWGNDGLFSLIYHLKSHTIKRKQCIYKFGDPVESVYFIQSGEVEITQAANVVMTGEEFVAKSVKTTKFSDLDQTKLFDMNAIWKSKFSQAQKHDIKIAILGMKQSFGEEEVFTDVPIRKSKAVAKSSTVELLSVPIEWFLLYGKPYIDVLDSPKNIGAKKKWRDGFENQILEVNNHNGIKTQESAGVNKHTEPMDIPVIFAKKNERIGTKHVRSISMEGLPLKLDPFPQDRFCQIDGVYINPLMKRKPKSSLKVFQSSLKIYTPGELISQRARLQREKSAKIASRVPSAVSRDRSKDSMMVQSPTKKLIEQGIPEPSSPFVSSPTKKTRYISFVQTIKPSSQRPKSGRYDSLRVSSAREVFNRKSLEASPVESLRPSMKILRDDEIPVSNRFKDMKCQQTLENDGSSSVVYRSELNKLIFPVPVKTHKEHSASKTSKIAVASLLSPTSPASQTPMNNQSTQLSVRIPARPMTARLDGASRVYSTQGFFQGSVVGSKIHSRQKSIH